jgi:ectoine hydroxylase-related dioxygenase (phytanoyl-CoA dioxygenase family)
MSAGISDEQLRSFDENGYVVLPSALGASDVRKLREEADWILELIINSSLANRRKSGRLNICQRPGGSQVVRRIQPVSDLSLFLHHISEDCRLLGPIERLLGGEAALMEEKITYKEPLPEPVSGIECEPMDDRFAVHSDWAYYKDQGYPRDLVSSAIALDDCTEASGPLRVWPASHKEHREHERTEVGRQVLPHLIDLNGGMDLLVPAGSIMIFHSMLVHSSRVNASGRPRRLLIYSHYLKRSGVAFDTRNGPLRLQELPYERQYQRMKDTGEFKDVFKAPRFDDQAPQRG